MMNSKSVIHIFIQFAIFNAAYSQSLGRILPNCGLNGFPINDVLLGNPNYLPYDLPYEILPNILPGGLQPNGLPLPNAVQRLPNVMQSLPSLIPQPTILQSGLPNVLQQGIVNPAIVQEDTVASNLANALQLLVVSNLLRNKLPQATDVVEYVTAPLGYNYLY